MENQISIYAITNRINGKQYVGQTGKRARDRVSQHGHSARYRIKQGKIATPIGRAVIAFGTKAFDCAVLEEVPQGEADCAERLWILRLGTMEPNGYNCLTGGKKGFDVPSAVIARRETLLARMNKSRSFTGEGNNAARLTEDQVREIRRRYGVGGISQRELGEVYGVRRTTIAEIVRRRNWKHI